MPLVVIELPKNKKFLNSELTAIKETTKLVVTKK